MQEINPAELAARTWSFGTADGVLFARNVVLGSNGKFLHHPSPNEDRWRMDGDALLLIAADGRVSCRMHPVHDRADGRLSFEGEHILGGPSGLILALRDTGIHYPVYLKWSEAYEDFAEKVPFYYSSERRIRGVIPPGTLITMYGPVLVEPESCLPQGEFVSIGAYSYCHGSFRSYSRAQIGRYCSIAGSARPFGPSHPMERITTSTFTYDPSMAETARRYGRDDFTPIPYDQFEPPVMIEHDVWIGEDAMIRGGVTIGTGAVIAAGSIVTRDVAPYTIAAGVPARGIKKQFSDDLIKRFLASRWWEYNFIDLPDCYDNPPRFLDELEQRRNAGLIAPWRPTAIDLSDALLHCLPTEP